MDRAALHIGAVAFIHRFSSSLNGHVHFHVCVVDGVFEEVAGDTAAQSSTPGDVIFHSASAIDETTVAQVQADLCRRILRAFVGRGLIEQADAKEMLAYQHSGFSVDAGVCIEAHDRAALERLLHYYTCGDGAGQRGPNHPRACDTQTVKGALPVGGVDRPHLRGFSLAVPAVWWTDAPDRLHYRGHADPQDP